MEQNGQEVPASRNQERSAFLLVVAVIFPLLAFGIVARTTPGLDMVSVGLGVAALGLVAIWIAAVPLLAHSVGLGVEQLTGWLGRLR